MRAIYTINRDTRGASSIEYALLVALLTIAVVPTASQVTEAAGHILHLRGNSTGRAFGDPAGNQLISGDNENNGSKDHGGGTWGSLAQNIGSSAVPSDGITRSGTHGTGSNGKTAVDNGQNPTTEPEASTQTRRR